MPPIFAQMPDPSTDKPAVVNPHGEQIFPIVGRSDTGPGTKNHSIGLVVVPKGCYSEHHRHPKEADTEETYEIRKGHGVLVVNGKKTDVKPGDFITILPDERHQIFNFEDEPLQFIVTCALAWTPENTVFEKEDSIPVNKRTEETPAQPDNSATVPSILDDAGPDAMGATERPADDSSGEGPQ